MRVHEFSNIKYTLIQPKTDSQICVNENNWNFMWFFFRFDFIFNDAVTVTLAAAAAAVACYRFAIATFFLSSNSLNVRIDNIIYVLDIYVQILISIIVCTNIICAFWLLFTLHTRLHCKKKEVYYTNLCII